MAALLELPEVRERLSRLSVEEYHRLDEFNEHGRRTELIRGFIIEKMSKSPLHRIVTSRLFRLFQSQLPEGYSVWKEEPLTLADSEPEPDISITRGGEKEVAHAHPGTAELVVEVAISSAALDRANASLYAEAAVKEYWIVLANQRSVEVYRKPKDGKYAEQITVGADEVLACAHLPSISVILSKLFAA
jgi:Uma2 family endonuclease